MHDNFENVSVGLNYGTTKVNQNDVIYIESETSIITVTIPEAIWISDVLNKYIDMFTTKED